MSARGPGPPPLKRLHTRRSVFPHTDQGFPTPGFLRKSLNRGPRSVEALPTAGSKGCETARGKDNEPRTHVRNRAAPVGRRRAPPATRRLGRRRCPRPLRANPSPGSPNRCDGASPWRSPPKVHHRAAHRRAHHRAPTGVSGVLPAAAGQARSPIKMRSFASSGLTPWGRRGRSLLSGLTPWGRRGRSLPSGHTPCGMRSFASCGTHSLGRRGRRPKPGGGVRKWSTRASPPDHVPGMNLSL